MRIFKLYDLRTGEVIEIPYIRHDRNIYLPEEGHKAKRYLKRRKAMKRLWVESIKIFISFSVGLIFWMIISGMMEKVRGHEAVGGEVFLAGAVSLFVYSILKRR